jgi:hypothetical protein
MPLLLGANIFIALGAGSSGFGLPRWVVGFIGKGG